MRVLGLGIDEAYHPWSEKSHGKYTSQELLNHLVDAVIPLETECVSPGNKIEGHDVFYIVLSNIEKFY